MLTAKLDNMEEKDFYIIKKNGLNLSHILILELIGKLGSLSTSHIAEYMIKAPANRTKVEYIRRLLRQMERKGYIYHENIRAADNKKYNYFNLTKEGKEWICQKTGQDKNIAYSTRLFTNKHQDILGEIGVKILKIIKDKKELKNGGIIDCFNDSSIYYRTEMNLFRNALFGNPKKGLRPDLTYINEFAQKWAFFEIDTGTETLTTISDKLNNYKDIIILQDTLRQKRLFIKQVKLTFVLCSPDPYRKRMEYINKLLNDKPFSFQVINYYEEVKNNTLEEKILKGIIF